MKKILSFLLLMIATTTNASTITLNSQNAVALRDYIFDVSAQKVVDEARELDNLYPNAGPIYLVIYSGGGSIEAGIEMINNLKSLKRPVKTITLFAASMAFHTVQALDERLMVEHGTLMQHKARGTFTGEFPDGQVDHKLEYWRKRVNNLQAVTAKRSGYSVELVNRLFDNEYWCNVNDCLPKHFADRKVEVYCDKTLSGTKTTEDNHFIGTDRGIVKLTYVYEYEKCPLQTTPLSSNITVNMVGNEGSGVTLDRAQLESLGIDVNQMINDRREAKPRGWFKREFSFEEK